MKLFNLLSCVCILLDHVRSQFSQSQQSNPLINPLLNGCEAPSNTTLVEHFFNLIFSEFHSRPPVCVCVQMCIDQPTYCYPNGCFKKADNVKRRASDSITAQVKLDPSKAVTFLVDSHSNFMENLLNNKYINEPKLEKTSFEKIAYDDAHRDPFKDRYQSIFKYKKSPKVHLRYNLREQVKHMKSDVIRIEKIDVSKTRWPIKDNKYFFLDPNAKSSDHNKIYPGIDNDPTEYKSKFFKRELTRKFTPNMDSFESSTENSSFSLENLIENLIESSFGPLTNDTELDLNVNLDFSSRFNTTMEPITLPFKRSLLNDKSIIILNETTNVVSLNQTNQNLEENKYTDVSANQQTYKNIFNDMIASLSRHIDRNNNSSVEMMEQLLGNSDDVTERIFDINSKEERIADITTSPLTTFSIEVTPTTTTAPETTLLLEYSFVTPSMIPFTTEYRRLVTTENMLKKSHQRVVRKLHNSKTN